MPDPFVTASQTELPRDRWGRPLISPPEGGEPVAYTRVTTLAKCIEDTYNLSRWQMRMVALGIARRRDLILAASAINDPDDYGQKRTLNEVAESAVEAAAGHAKANAGTALHSYAERVDRHEALGYIPEEYEADVAAYARVTEGLDILVTEAFVIVDALRVGGSLDKVMVFTAEYLDRYAEEHRGARLHYPNGDEVQPGDAVIGDIKTGNTDFALSAISMQLGTYANGVVYDHALGTRSPIPGDPRKDYAVIIALPSGKGNASLIWLDITKGWDAAQRLAYEVLQWRKERKTLGQTFAFVDLGPSAGPTLVEQINAATSRDELVALYAANAAQWTPGLTSLASKRIEALK